MARTHNLRAATLGLPALLAAALLAVSPAAAQNVPVPKSRPEATQKAAKPAPKLAANEATFARPRSIPPGGLVAQAQAPKPSSNPFAGLLGKPGGATGQLTPEQRGLIDKINAYLSNTQKLTGRFVQVGPDGRKTEGEFYMAKPGRVRFEYDDPSPIEMIADGDSVVVRDRNLATQDVYPLSQTPLRFLLSNRVDLMRDADLKAVYADDVFITAIVEEHNGIVGTSRLMIMFDAKDMQLKQWTVTDPQGYDTTVAVYNLDTTKTPDPSLFRIDYTRYR
ncbi:MAG: outer membrane lipoprotein carrier protein LolA [Pseudolabrys sp.]|nr:outer membrane lipoprotein carrier protein LolA [Pseudolabrys sp.]